MCHKQTRADAATRDTLPLRVTSDTSYAYGPLIKTDSLFSLCFPVQIAPAAVCQNGVMDEILRPIEPPAFRLTVSKAFLRQPTVSAQLPTDQQHPTQKCRPSRKASRGAADLGRRASLAWGKADLNSQPVGCYF
jgi:hypothetical protein